DLTSLESLLLELLATFDTPASNYEYTRLVALTILSLNAELPAWLVDLFQSRDHLDVLLDIYYDFGKVDQSVQLLSSMSSTFNSEKVGLIPRTQINRLLYLLQEKQDSSQYVDQIQDLLANIST
ncbi:MAG: hypothetical protein Q8P67_24285, partial [archaeon]|nr:hypothetical protein [archaeon]